jgi:hypothetical protein
VLLAWTAVRVGARQRPCNQWWHDFEWALAVEHGRRAVELRESKEANPHGDVTAADRKEWRTALALYERDAEQTAGVAAADLQFARGQLSAAMNEWFENV